MKVQSCISRWPQAKWLSTERWAPSSRQKVLGVSKNRGTPNGWWNKGNPYFLMDDLGVFPYLWKQPLDLAAQFLDLDLLDWRGDFEISVQAKEEAAIGDAEATQRAKTLQELLSKEVPIVGMKVDWRLMEGWLKVDGRLMEGWCVCWWLDGLTQNWCLFFVVALKIQNGEILGWLIWMFQEPRLLQLFEERRQRYDLDFARLRELKPGTWWKSR